MENADCVAQEKPIATNSSPSGLEILNGHIERAERGDFASLPHVQRHLDDAPELVVRLGDLATRIQAKWILAISGEDLVLRDCVVRHLTQLRAKLTVESLSDVLPIMVEDVLTAWLRKYYYEVRLSEHTNESVVWSQYRLEEFTTMQQLYERSLSNLLLARK